MILTEFFLNRYFLPGYYERQKIREMENAYASVDAMIAENGKEQIFYSDFFSTDAKTEKNEQNLFRELSDKSNIDAVLVDSETGIYIGASREDSWLLSKLETYIRFSDIMEGGVPKSKRKTVKTCEKYTVQRVFDVRTDTMFLEAWGRLSDDSIWFLMSIPLESIAESTGIMNRFLLFVGCCVLVAGSVLIYFATDAVTRPVNRLAQISEKMSRLDFTEKYEGNEEDEIGVLGKSMNSMSETLEKTISDLRDANAKLQEDIHLKEKIDNMRKDFISNVSHELKTPISLIEGYAEGLCEGMGDDPETREYYCSVIMDESRKMNQMVKQLTFLTNYEFGAEKLTIEQFDLVELLRNVLQNFSVTLKEKEAVITEILPESCNVLADEFKIEEVFTNYMTNALNHLGGEKKIRVELERLDVKTVMLSVYNDGERIPEESIEHIWEKFYKVDKARTREYGGSGIGLSIVKAIMDAHHQKYGVENREKGVRFYVTLDSVE